MTVTEKIHETREIIAGKVWLSIIETTDNFGDTYFGVRISDGTDYADEVGYEDYGRAAAHMRDVARQMGVVIPYQAPQFEEPVAADPDAVPERSAVDIFYEYQGLLGQTYAGSDAAHEIQNLMLVDEEFAAHSQEILVIAGEGRNWALAMIRTCCRRIEAKAAQAIQRDNPQFGMF